MYMYMYVSTSIYVVCVYNIYFYKTYESPTQNKELYDVVVMI